MIVETPDIVTIEIEGTDGKPPIEVHFTRDEFTRVEAAASARSMTIKEFLVWASLEEARNPTLRSHEIGSA